jgi:hypothetical protein
MSHATGKVFTDTDTPIAYFDYDGTCDFAVRKLYLTSDEMWEHVREEPDSQCSCGNPPIEVILETDYGNGIEWYSTACLNCMTITGEVDPYRSKYGNDWG